MRPERTAAANRTRDRDGLNRLQRRDREDAEIAEKGHLRGGSLGGLCGSAISASKEIGFDRNRTTPRGFTLVEMAVALVALGILALAALALWRHGAQERTAMVERHALARSEDAVIGFAFANHRLPCPDTTGDGREDCSGGGLGALPWRTVGLSQPGAQAPRYGVFRRADSSVATDADLAVALDRLRPLLATGTPPAGLETPLGNRNGIDLCLALDSASLAPMVESIQPDGSIGPTAEATRLHTVTEDGTARHVAFALALPGRLDADGDGDLFDGRQAQQSATLLTFDAPRRPRAAAYDDEVRAWGFEALFSRLGCAGTLSAASHAHANTATAAALLRQALADYKRVLEIKVLMAGASVATSTAVGLSGVGGVANATAATTLAVAQTILSHGAMGPAIAAGAAAIAASAAVVAGNVVTLAIVIAAAGEAIDRVTDVAPLVTDSAALADSIEANVRIADAAGL